MCLYFLILWCCNSFTRHACLRIPAGYLEVEYPMLFQLESQSSGKVTHCGVLEFTAEEGMILLPSWVMMDSEYNTIDVWNYSIHMFLTTGFGFSNLDDGGYGSRMGWSCGGKECQFAKRDICEAAASLKGVLRCIQPKSNVSLLALALLVSFCCILFWCLTRAHLDVKSGDDVEELHLPDHRWHHCHPLQQQDVLCWYTRNQAIPCNLHYRHWLWGRVRASFGLCRTWETCKVD